MSHAPDAKPTTRRTKPYEAEETKKWAEEFEGGDSILKIAARHAVDPGTVSKWLHKLGIEFKQGHHRVEQPPLKYPDTVVGLLSKGAKEIIALLGERVWGAQVTQDGFIQLDRFCRFALMHKRGLGVREIAETLHVHRSTIAKWREGTDQPYLVKVAIAASEHRCEKGWKILPLHLSSGAESQSDWIEVPDEIREYADVVRVVSQLSPLPSGVDLAKEFGLKEDQLAKMRPELFAYLLAMMAGDSGKSGGAQARYASMNLDLQLTLKQPSNERFGRFVCFCAGALGIRMARIKDKPATGDSRVGQQPTPAYRWTSERSPFLTWMFSVCLGMKWTERTSNDQLRIEWILRMPFGFRLRFAQGMADSDGTVKPYEVVITSVPNAEFVTKLLSSLGMKSAHTIHESGRPLRTMVNAREAASLPIFSEFVRSYRYAKLMKFRRLEPEDGNVLA